MLDPDPLYRPLMTAICGCDFLTERDIDDEPFFEEMRTRPIRQGGDLENRTALKMSAIVPRRAADVEVGGVLIVCSFAVWVCELSWVTI